MSSTSSSSSTTRVLSSASSSGTTIILSTSSISSTDIAPVPTFTPGPNNGNNGGNGGGGFGNGGNNGGNGIASSAALYLYTFLATLVLLLSVSAAIVVRSFILRRRHRRMVEEAIRNGTWVPPNVPPSGRAPRVDLSKKPVMWEAYLGGGGIYRAEKGGRDLASSYSYGGDKASLGGLEGAEWEGIKPFSASFVHPATHSGVNGGRGGVGSSASEDANDSASGVTGNRPSFVHRIGAGVRHILRTTSSPAGPLPPNANSNNAALNAGANPEAGNAEGEGVVGELEKPPTVRVAVLIAMPTPPKASSASSSSNVSQSPEGPSTSSMVLSPAASHPLSALNSQQQPQSSLSSDSEEPLPVLEMGVAEVVLLNHDVDGGRLSGEMGRVPPGKEAVGRDSASMTVEV